MSVDAHTIEIREFIKESAAPVGSSIAEAIEKLAWHDDKAGAFYVTEADTMPSRDLESGLPWVGRGLQEIAKLGSLDPSWHETGAPVPNNVATELATVILQQLSLINFRPNSIDASADEGICISFARRDRTANVECFNTGEVLAVTMPRGGEPTIWSITNGTILSGLVRIHEFVGD
jgi:hypothetical protein